MKLDRVMLPSRVIPSRVVSVTLMPPQQETVIGLRRLKELESLIQVLQVTKSLGHVIYISLAHRANQLQEPATPVLEARWMAMPEDIA